MRWDIQRRFCSIELWMGKNGEYKYQKDISNWINCGENGNAKITFQTQTALITTEATITLYNLTKTQIERLAITSNMWSNETPYNNVIRLYAGYIGNNGRDATKKEKDPKERSNYCLIFEGNIIATKTNLSSSNFSITLTAKARFNDIQRQVGDTLVDLSGEQKVRTILTAIANKYTWTDLSGKPAFYGVNVHPACENLTKKDYNCTGNLRDQLNYCNTIWEPFGHCFILSPSNNIIWCNPITYDELPAKKLWVDYKTNLIGSIQPTELGFECDITLTPYINRSYVIFLNNVSFPRLNTDIKNKDKFYTLVGFSHSGDTYGNDWRTHLVCVRQDLYKGNYTGVQQ